MADVAAPIVRELRLALLAPAELSALEEQNRREPLIPVRTRGSRLRSTRQHGGKARRGGRTTVVGWGVGGWGVGALGDSMVTGFPLQVEQIVEAWKCHAMRRGDAARVASCRRRRGTLPREHHRFLDLPFK